jgi:hypothetical protein
MSTPLLGKYYSKYNSIRRTLHRIKNRNSKKFFRPRIRWGLNLFSISCNTSNFIVGTYFIAAKFKYITDERFQ